MSAVRTFRSSLVRQGLTVIAAIGVGAASCTPAWPRVAAGPPAVTDGPPAPSSAPTGGVGFGVTVPGGFGDASGAVEGLGARWIRLNVNLGRPRPDPRRYLSRGIDVVLTVSNRDPENADQTYGTPGGWPNAGFPFRSADRYSRELREVLTPLVPFLSAGRQVWVQCENEVVDASVVPRSSYWRGTTAQYLALERVFHDTVKSVDPRMRVVLSSFSSMGLAEAVAGDTPGSKEHVRFYEALLRDASYDAVDLHFYGCVSGIPSKVGWVRRRMTSNAEWISTENGGPDGRCPSTPLSWALDQAAFERAQAAQVPQRLRACAESGGAVCLWFSLFDLPRGGPIFGHLGLLDESTWPPRQKPAYEAFRAFVDAEQR